MENSDCTQRNSQIGGGSTNKHGGISIESGRENFFRIKILASKLIGGLPKIFSDKLLITFEEVYTTTQALS